MQGSSKGSDGSGGVITWNPRLSSGGLDENNNTIRPSFIGLGHELIHANDANYGVLYGTTDYTNPISGAVYLSKYRGVEKVEWRAVYGENLIRRELQLPLRKYYYSTFPYGPPMITNNRKLINYP